MSSRKSHDAIRAAADAADRQTEQRLLTRILVRLLPALEFGQLVIALCLLPLAYWLNHWKHGRKVAVGISLLLAAFGTAWFVDRAFNLELMQRFGL